MSRTRLENLTLKQAKKEILDFAEQANQFHMKLQAATIRPGNEQSIAQLIKHASAIEAAARKMAQQFDLAQVRGDEEALTELSEDATIAEIRAQIEDIKQTLDDKVRSTPEDDELTRSGLEEQIERLINKNIALRVNCQRFKEFPPALARLNAEAEAIIVPEEEVREMEARAAEEAAVQALSDTETGFISGLATLRAVSLNKFKEPDKKAHRDVVGAYQEVLVSKEAVSRFIDDANRAYQEIRMDGSRGTREKTHAISQLSSQVTAKLEAHQDIVDNYNQLVRYGNRVEIAKARFESEDRRLTALQAELIKLDQKFIVRNDIAPITAKTAKKCLEQARKDLQSQRSELYSSSPDDFEHTLYNIAMARAIDATEVVAHKIRELEVSYEEVCQAQLNVCHQQVTDIELQISGLRRLLKAQRGSFSDREYAKFEANLEKLIATKASLTHSIEELAEKRDLKGMKKQSEKLLTLMGGVSAQRKEVEKSASAEVFKENQAAYQSMTQNYLDLKSKIRPEFSDSLRMMFATWEAKYNHQISKDAGLVKLLDRKDQLEQLKLESTVGRLFEIFQKENNLLTSVDEIIAHDASMSLQNLLELGNLEDLKFVLAQLETKGALADATSNLKLQALTPDVRAFILQFAERGAESLKQQRSLLALPANAGNQLLAFVDKPRERALALQLAENEAGELLSPALLSDGRKVRNAEVLLRVGFKAQGLINALNNSVVSKAIEHQLLSDGNNTLSRAMLQKLANVDDDHADAMIESLMQLKTFKEAPRLYQITDKQYEVMFKQILTSSTADISKHLDKLKKAIAFVTRHEEQLNTWGGDELKQNFDFSRQTLVEVLINESIYREEARDGLLRLDGLEQQEVTIHPALMAALAPIPSGSIMEGKEPYAKQQEAYAKAYMNLLAKQAQGIDIADQLAALKIPRRDTAWQKIGAYAVSIDVQAFGRELCKKTDEQLQVMVELLNMRNEFDRQYDIDRGFFRDKGSFGTTLMPMRANVGRFMQQDLLKFDRDSVDLPRNFAAVMDNRLKLIRGINESFKNLLRTDNTLTREQLWNTQQSINALLLSSKSQQQISAEIKTMISDKFADQASTGEKVLTAVKNVFQAVGFLALGAGLVYGLYRKSQGLGFFHSAREDKAKQVADLVDEKTATLEKSEQPAEQEDELPRSPMPGSSNGG